MIHCWESSSAIASVTCRVIAGIGRTLPVNATPTAAVSMAASRTAASSGSRSAGWSWRCGKTCLAAARLLDRGDDADDLLDGDPPVVDTDQHPADDVVDRRPLHALESLQVTAQRPADLGLLLGGRRGHLDVHGARARPDTRRVCRARGGSSMPRATPARLPDVPVGDAGRRR